MNNNIKINWASAAIGAGVTVVAGFLLLKFVLTKAPAAIHSIDNQFHTDSFKSQFIHNYMNLNKVGIDEATRTYNMYVKVLDDLKHMDIDTNLF